MPPITPEEAQEPRPDIPEYVFDAFNELIVKNLTGKRSVVMQDEVADLAARLGDVSKSYLYDEKYLDVERHYEQAGWKVVYDKPAYNETYRPTFTFTKP